MEDCDCDVRQIQSTLDFVDLFDAVDKMEMALDFCSAHLRWTGRGQANGQWEAELKSGIQIYLAGTYALSFFLQTMRWNLSIIITAALSDNLCAM